MARVFKWIIVLAILGGIGYGGWYWYQQRQAPTISYRTAQVKRGDVVSAISATGTVVPEDVVDVGTQVNGQIASFGNDKSGKPVDYRSEVDEGMVLALIDDSLYAADVATSTAQLEQAKAQVKVATANRDQAQARLDQAQRDWERAQKLGPSSALSQADYDAARSAYEQAVANLAVTEATIAQAKASVSIAEASVLRSRRNLAYCTIASPVSGVIIDRRVDIGQTVVASFNAPSLFLLAKDLKRMQVLVQVNEADIGNVNPGQEVAFGVDAFPNQQFKGEVRKVRLNATMTQNVVTYTVEIVTDNSDLKLLPYLSANVRFIVSRHEDVLTVPNAALRWAPRSQASAGSGRSSGMGMGSGSGGPGGGNRGSGAPAGAQQGTGREGGQRTGGQRGGGSPAAASPSVWILQNGVPTQIPVKTGVTDGIITEISGDIPEGAEVIVGEQSSATASGPSGASPFTPQMFRGGGNRGGGR